MSLKFKKSENRRYSKKVINEYFGRLKSLCIKVERELLLKADLPGTAEQKIRSGLLYKQALDFEKEVLESKKKGKRVVIDHKNHIQKCYKKIISAHEKYLKVNERIAVNIDMFLKNMEVFATSGEKDHDVHFRKRWRNIRYLEIDFTYDDIEHLIRKEDLYKEYRR